MAVSFSERATRGLSLEDVSEVDETADATGLANSLGVAVPKP